MIHSGEMLLFHAPPSVDSAYLAPIRYPYG